MENVSDHLKCLPSSLRRALRPVPNLLSDFEQVTSPSLGPQFPCGKHENPIILCDLYQISDIRCQHLLIGRRNDAGVLKGRGLS